MSRTYYSKAGEKGKYCFDYKKQVWIIGGLYQNCGHAESMNCDCYGRKHAGELATITEDCH